MNTAGYDLAVLGNHEFDYGIERMQEIMNGLSAKTISINILKDGLQVFDSSVVLEVGGTFEVNPVLMKTSSDYDVHGICE